jgi:hypothetical protein
MATQKSQKESRFKILVYWNIQMAQTPHDSPILKRNTSSRLSKQRQNQRYHAKTSWLRLPQRKPNSEHFAATRRAVLELVRFCTKALTRRRPTEMTTSPAPSIAIKARGRPGQASRSSMARSSRTEMRRQVPCCNEWLNSINLLTTVPELQLSKRVIPS